MTTRGLDPQRWPLTIRVPAAVAALVLVVCFFVAEVLVSRFASAQERNLDDLLGTYLDGVAGSVLPHVVANDVWGTVDVGPIVALITKAAGSLSSEPSTVAIAPFLTDPGLVHEPERDLLVRVGRGYILQSAAQPPLAKAAWACGFERGWTGRVFCRDRLSPRTMRDRLVGCRRLPNRPSIQAQSRGSVHSPPPSSGRGLRNTVARKAACSPSVSAGGRPDFGRSRRPSSPSTLNRSTASRSA